MKLTALLLLLVFFASCTKTVDEQPDSRVTDRTSLTLGSNLNAVDSFDVTFNGDWTIAYSPASVSWLQVSTMSGVGQAKIFVSVTEQNTTTSSRTVQLIVTPANSTLEPVTVTVTQGAYAFSAWQKLFGGSDWDMLLSTVATPDGGFIAAGNTRSTDGDVSANSGDSDLWVVKVDAAGNIVWEKTYGTNRYENGTKIIRTQDGYAALGVVVRDGFENGINQITKIDENGGVIWEKTFSFGGNINIASITNVPSHGIICSGTKNDDAYLMLLDHSGDTLWTRTFASARLDRLRDVTITDDGGFFAVGNKDFPSSGTTVDYVSQDAWVIKGDIMGNIVWEKYFGGSGLEWGYKILATDDGGALIEAYTESNDVPGYKGFDDILLTKIDGDGNLSWHKAYGSTGSDFCHDIQKLDNDRFIFTAQVGNIIDGDVPETFGETDAWVVTINGSGDIVSNTVYGDSAIDVFVGIAVGTDKIGFVGHSASTTWDFASNHGGIDAWFKAVDLP